MITFNCLLPHVAEKMPIIPAHQVDFEWVAKAKEIYATEQPPKEVTKCPGIFSLLSTGWIHRTYMDITVETNGDYSTFNTWTEEDQFRATPAGNFLGEYVSFHGDHQFKFKDFPANTMRTLLKIQSPWFVDIPKGYSLLMMPIPYHDDVRFTPALGLLKGKNFLNVQMYWHCLKGKQFIKAGTPISQMVLIKDTSTAHTINVVDDVQKFLSENYYQYDQMYDENGFRRPKQI